MAKPVMLLKGQFLSLELQFNGLRDGLKFIESAEQSETLAMQADESQDVYLVPAL